MYLDERKNSCPIICKCKSVCSYRIEGNRQREENAKKVFEYSSSSRRTGVWVLSIVQQLNLSSSSTIVGWFSVRHDREVDRFYWAWITSLGFYVGAPLGITKRANAWRPYCMGSRYLVAIPGMVDRILSPIHLHESFHQKPHNAKDRTTTHNYFYPSPRNGHK